jgi:acetyltransferase
MSTYRIEELLHPKLVCLIGGSERKTSVGRAVLNNLLTSNFSGAVQLVNSKYETLLGRRAVASVAALDSPPDLAIITTPAETIPDQIEALGRLGCKSAIIISAGLGSGAGSYFEATRLAARRYGLRLVGPNCIGVLSPAAHLNASFAARMPRPGDLALISQSGAIVAGVIEWASSRNVGFSSIVSVGDQIDVDFGDLLNHFSGDSKTRAILMYIESVPDARKFMSAARVAARLKPVVVLKAGRFKEGARAAATHTGAMAGSDAVYDAAFRRAGLLRAFDLEELFDAAGALSVVRPFKGDRLAVLTNGGGLGVLAVDQLAELNGTLATLSDELRQTLNAGLPSNWSKGNPVDIIGDADAERYDFAFRHLLEDDGNDAILVMNVATSLASSLEIAKSVSSTVGWHRTRVSPAKPVLAAWVTDDRAVRQVFSEASVPMFETETAAVQAFTQLVRYSAAQEVLRATPPRVADSLSPDRTSATELVRASLSSGQQWMNAEQSHAILQAYDIPAVASRMAASPAETRDVARQLLRRAESIALKIVSPDIVHKSDIGGVRLNIRSESEAEQAAADILDRAARLRPDARVRGLLLQEMVELPNSREVIVGVANDPAFGRVIVFGQGGVSVEVVGDKAIGLPPLDLNLANDLIARTRVSKLLGAYRNIPAANRRELALLLVKISQMISDLPEITEMDLNPVLVNADRVIALDTRILLAEPRSVAKGSHLAIRPYPNEWEQILEYGQGETAFVRPMRPEDEELVAKFFEHITAQDLRLRFFNVVRNPSHTFLARLTQLDYARAMAFLALDRTGSVLGVVRLHSDANYETGEYAILVRSDLKGKGLGWRLMELIIRYAREEGLTSIFGEVLAENTTMLDMCAKLGFKISEAEGERDVKIVRLPLKSS